MLVISFDPNIHNYIIVGEERYFLFRISGSGWIVVNDRCLHRGGPLHLGSWDTVANCLTCPWHSTKYSEKILRKRAAPLIYAAGRATVILDVNPGAEVKLCNKTIFPQAC